MKKVVLFLAKGFEEVEALTPVDVLRRAGINVTTVSISNDLRVTGARQITVLADALFTDIDYSNIDMIILPGGMPGTSNLNNHQELRKLLVDFAAKNKLIAAICAAPMILGELGLLKGKTVTCYPGFESHLKGANVTTQSVVTDKNIITG
ncbi:MAG: DJ-1/PfpI family protein, partial [Marinilabiliaceae bacterium]|nr:DJ-1/PfpI family protein [Marinilabiliaceae bacterium]